MKVLLYFEGKHLLSKSGIGRAYDHQRKALEAVDVEYTCELNQTDYDILHINTYGIRSQKVIRKARKNQKKICRIQELARSRRLYCKICHFSMKRMGQMY